MTVRRAALRTGWIAIAGTLLLSWLVIAIWSFVDLLGSMGENGDSFGEVLQKSFLGTLLMLVVLGAYFWIMLGLSVVALDFYLFRESVQSIRTQLLIEWGVISLVLVALAAATSLWLIIVFALPFLLAQLYREKNIHRMIAATEKRERFDETRRMIP